MFSNWLKTLSLSTQHILAARCLLVCLCLIAFELPAHESWIEPEQFRIADNEKIRAHIRVGQNFNGDSHSYNTKEYKTLTKSLGAKTQDIKGRLGNIPAIQTAPMGLGLHVLRHQSNGSQLEYDDLEKFAEFAEKQGLQQYVAEHRASGKPDGFFRERFIRFSKTLIAVGNTEGEDAGGVFPLEIVAIDNPYDTPTGQAITFELRWQNVPLQNWQVNVFERLSADKNDTHNVNTDKLGQFQVTPPPGAVVMLNAVQLYDPENTGYDRKTVWESAWASLTFARQ